MEDLAQLARVFAEVRRVLRPGGLFVFDVNTREGHRARWKGTFAAAHDWGAIVCRFQSGERAEMRATGFVPDGDKWKRFDETHRQIALEWASLEPALREAGFADARVLRDEGLPADPGRLWISAVSPSGSVTV